MTQGLRTRMLAMMAVAVLGLAPGVTRADFTFDTSNIPSAKNINLQSATDVATVLGETQQVVNGNPVMVMFGNAGVHLDASNGAATISATGSKNTFTTLTATIQSGFGVTDMDFKLQPNNANLATDFVTLVAYDQFGNMTTSQNLLFTNKNGENDFAVHAINGELLTQLVITSTVALNSAKQFSVLGVRAVPEPSSIAMLGIGTVAMGLTAYRRRRRAVSIA